jgi:hypothetical protein
MPIEGVENRDDAGAHPMLGKNQGFDGTRSKGGQSIG